MLEEGKSDYTTTPTTKDAQDADVITIGGHVFQVRLETIKNDNGSFFIFRATEIITKDVFEFKRDEKSLLAMNWPNSSMESVKKFLTSVIFDADVEMTVKYGFIKSKQDEDNENNDNNADDNKEEKKEEFDDDFVLSVDYDEGDDMVILIQLEYKWMKQNWRLDLKYVPQDEVKRLKVLVKDLREEIDKLKSFQSGFTGMITMWSGNKSEIPEGWALCDGNNGTPNLTNRFILGSNSSVSNVKNTGGSTTHTHNITVNGHRLTINEMPSHRHTVCTYNKCGDTYGSQDASRYKSCADTQETILTNGVGGSQAHSHSASSNSREHMPPYYILGFIMKM